MIINYMRSLSFIDQLVIEIDAALRTVCIPKQRLSNRTTPGHDLLDVDMSVEEKRHVAGLMRVNHAGEVCAQALYQGQALTAKLEQVKMQMLQASAEETDHLAWCEQRLSELNSQPSSLNPLWYAGSFILGALAGLAGDRWSLGFVAETERQVSDHLQRHREDVPTGDLKSHAILAAMQADELQHADTARAAGGVELPFAIQKLMKMVSGFMTFGSYYL